MITVRCRKALQSAKGPIDLTVDLSIKEGACAAVFGESGSGKTTVLRMIAGLTRPDEGYINVGGRVLFDSTARIDLPTQERRTGMVFQDHNVFPNMTVIENIRYAMRPGDDGTFATDLLKAADLVSLADVLPAKLSGGQRQRVAFIRAMVNRPDLLLLDEPFSSLDTAMRIRLQDEVAAWHRKYGVTAIVVSHDITEVMRLADTVFCLTCGKVTAFGNPEDVFVKQRLSSKFKLVGTVAAIDHDGVVAIVTVVVGSELVRVVADEGEAKALVVGDTVLVASKAFNPVIMKAVMR